METGDIKKWGKVGICYQKDMEEKNPKRIRNNYAVNFCKSQTFKNQPHLSKSKVKDQA